jgi:hypothetical protein
MTLSKPLVARINHPIRNGTGQSQLAVCFPKQQDTRVRRDAIIGELNLDCAVEYEADAWYPELHASRDLSICKLLMSDTNETQEVTHGFYALKEKS